MGGVAKDDVGVPVNEGEHQVIDNVGDVVDDDFGFSVNEGDTKSMSNLNIKVLMLILKSMILTRYQFLKIFTL